MTEPVTISAAEKPQNFTAIFTYKVNGIELANLTEADVVAWIEATETRLPGIKAHIQFVLDREVAKATLAATPMPWAPVPETPTEPAPTTP